MSPPCAPKHSIAVAECPLGTKSGSRQRGLVCGCEPRCSPGVDSGHHARRSDSERTGLSAGVWFGVFERIVRRKSNMIHSRINEDNDYIEDNQQTCRGQ